MEASKRKLRIAILGTRGVPHTYGGAEAWARELAPRLVERGHEVIVYCRRGLFKERPKYHKGVRLVYLPNIEHKVLGTPTHTFLASLDVLFRGVDVVFVVTVANAVFCLPPRLFGKQVAINVDGIEWKRDKWGRFGKRFFYWNAKIVGRICPKGVMTDAYEMHRIYLEQFNTPSVVVTAGASIVSSKDSGVVRQYGLEPFQYYLIASRMIPENNADLIVKAFEQSRSPRVLAIAGTANYKSGFFERLKQTRDPRVKFLGHIGDVDHLNEIHCNAYGYIHGHSMGGTNPALLKALGCGNFILALNTPFNAEVLQERYGVLFDKNSADLTSKLEYYEAHPELAAEYRNRAPERIGENYTWEHITDRHEELFLQLAAGDNPALIHSTVVNNPAAWSRTEEFYARQAKRRKVGQASDAEQVN